MILDEPIGRERNNRHVPEVNAVGAFAQPAQRRKTNDAGHPRVLVGKGQQSRSGGQGENGESSLVEPHGVIVGTNHHENNDGQTSQPDEVKKMAGDSVGTPGP